MTIGFHGQRPINNWLDAIKELPNDAPVLAVDDVHMLRDVKDVNPNLLTIFRKEWNHNQGLPTDYNQAKQKARDYFNSFIDGTWQQQELWHYIDVVKEWNEYVATSQSEFERQQIITWLRAVTTVWNTEYRSKPICGNRDIPLACISAAVGNEIDVRFAQIVADSDNIISYHNYTHFDFGKRDPQDWQYHSGRWSFMDAQFAAHGVKPLWISTEGGPYAGVYDGWKSSKVLNGNLQRYIDECIKYQLDHISEWNKANNNRYLGGVLFTFGNTGAWSQYELNTSEMIEIAKTVHNYTKEPIMTWQEEAWNESVERQAISLNPDASLQSAIFVDGFVPVQSEFWYRTTDTIQRAYMAAEHLQTGERRLYYAVVPNWNDVQWFNDPKA